MALSLNQTAALAGILKPGMKIASMGYPDIIAPVEFIHTFWPGCNDWEVRKDSEQICKRHGLEPCPIPDAGSFFSLLGCTLDVYDVVKERGCEIILDLNEPMKFCKQYDIVLDVGTAEHCFNIGQALINMAGLVEKGGYIIHENPFNWGNHGFYNLNPTLFADFYAVNGFTLKDCRLVGKDGEARISHTKRFRFTDGEVNVFALAQRVGVKSFVFPVQSKYANLIPAAVDSGERDAIERAKEIVNG